MFPEILYPAVRHDNDALTYPQSMPRIPWPSWSQVKRYFTDTGSGNYCPDYAVDMDDMGDGSHAV